MKRTLLAMSALFAFPAAGWSLGSAAIGNEDLSARSLSMGGASTAQTAEPVAAFANPAALPFLDGINVNVGGTLIVPDVTFKSASGQEEGMKSVPVFVPNFAASFPILPGKLHAGVAVEAPYGGDFQFSNTGAMRYLATKAILNMVDVSPAVGYKLTDSLSIGASLHYYDLFDLTKVANLNEFALNNALSFGSCPTPASCPDGGDDLHGTGQHVGWGASLFWKPSDEHAVGLTYRSQTTIHVAGSFSLSNLSGPSAALFGGTSYSTDASADIVVPATMQLGYSFKPNDRWNFELDAAWYGWSAYHNLAVNFADPNAARQAVLTTNSQGQQGPEPKNWKNVTSGAIGVEYKATDALKLRGGYAYQPAVGPDSTWHPEELDLTRHEVAVGVGYPFGRVNVDLTYLLVIFPSRTINNNVGAASLTPINGTWSGVTHLAVLNLSTRF